MRIDLDQLAITIVQAPMAGGPSTPALAVAVSEAGGLGFLAAGYKTAEAVAAEVRAVRDETSRPFGVNLFVPSAQPAPTAALSEYREALRAEADRYGVEVGEPSFDDDGYLDKLDLFASERLELVSFTFGCPTPEVVSRLTEAGTDVWVT